MSEQGRPETVRAAADALPIAFASCFRGPAGAVVLAHLRRLYLERRLLPKASDAELWHLEGQRSVVAYALAMIERGRGDLPPDLR